MLWLTNNMDAKKRTILMYCVSRIRNHVYITGSLIKKTIKQSAHPNNNETNKPVHAATAEMQK